MAIQPMALGVANPEINAVSALAAGQQARQSFDMNNIQIAKAGLETIGSIALGSMGGKIDGQADPALFNEGLDYLAQNGIDVTQFRDRADLAPVIARSSMTALQQIQAAQSEQEYQLALDKFELAVLEAAKGPKTSLTPVYGVDADGNPVVMQPRDDGTMAQTVMPDGVTVSKTPIKMDTGTEILMLDPITRAVISRTPKENYQEAYDASAGGEQAELDVASGATVGQAIANADTLLSQIDAVVNDPDLGIAVGLGGILPAVPGTPQAGVVARIEQIQGQAFLQAFQSLKGGGAITETEGKAATNAIARLSRAQNEEDFKDALDELRSIVEKGRERAIEKAAAGKPGAPPAIEAAPLAAPAATRLVYNPETGELE